jgi:hypothetical protein
LPAQAGGGLEEGDAKARAGPGQAVGGRSGDFGFDDSGDATGGIAEAAPLTVPWSLTACTPAASSARRTRAAKQTSSTRPKHDPRHAEPSGRRWFEWKCASPGRKGCTELDPVGAISNMRRIMWLMTVNRRSSEVFSLTRSAESDT